MDYFFVIFHSFWLGVDAKLVTDIRDIAKSLRTSHIKQLLHEKKLKEAVLDCNTRWNTVFDMVIFDLKLLFFNILLYV